MAVHVEPKPLHEPLAGGTKGSTVTVEPMVAGHVSHSAILMEWPGGHFKRLQLLRSLLAGSSRVKAPCPAFLIRHPSAGAILVDTGLHPSIAGGGDENFGRLATYAGRPTLEPGEDVPAQLRRRGLEPGEVPIVVMTHLHLDHTSAIAEFPQSTFVVSETEWREAAHGSNPLLNAYRRRHFDYAFEYRTVDFDRGGIDSYSSFGRTFDLFGDGSIHLAFTPGHSAGHMSVIARLRERDFVIGGDAVFTLRQLEDGKPPARPFDAHNWRRSLQELRLFRREFPQAIVTPGHDLEFYEQLEDRYE